MPKRFESPEVLVSKQIDYELAQYDEYMERAQHLVESGSVAEAGAFVGLGGSLLRESKDVQAIDDIKASRQSGHVRRVVKK